MQKAGIEVVFSKHNIKVHSKIVVVILQLLQYAVRLC